MSRRKVKRENAVTSDVLDRAVVRDRLYREFRTAPEPNQLFSAARRREERQVAVMHARAYLRRVGYRCDIDSDSWCVMMAARKRADALPWMS